MSSNFFNRKVPIKVKSVLLACFIISSFYIAWEYYWFTKVDWYFVKWHTHLTPYLFVLLLLFWMAQFISINEKKLLILLSVFTSLLIAEVLLFTLTKNGDYAFYSQFIINTKNYYHVWSPNEVHHFKNEEFDYSRHTNSLGFSDVEWKIQKYSCKIRILTLGDSFTEGDAAPTDSAYPYLMQKIFGENYEVMNAGTCGSDPIFNYKNLEDRLLKYKPDVVIQTISSHDLYKDIALRGGFERFLSDGNLQQNQPPLWFYPAMISAIFRKVIMLFKIDIYEPQIVNEKYLRNLEVMLQQLTDKYDNLGKIHHFKTVFVLLPLRSETGDKKYAYDYTSLRQMANKSTTIETLDLLPCYQHTITESGKDYASFYWKIDAHHNSTGYKMMAECIAQKVREVTKNTTPINQK